jgi:hypothetical protein
MRSVLAVLLCAGRSASDSRSEQQEAGLDQSERHATLWTAMEPARVTLSGDLSGDYLVEELRPDGRVVLRPNLSVTAILSRHNERELSPDEFEQRFAESPTDGEG